MVFVLLGVDVILGDGCEIWEHLEFQGSKISLELFQDVMDGYVKP